MKTSAQPPDTLALCSSIAVRKLQYEQRDAKLRRQNIIRAFLFVIFLSIGVAAIFVSIVCREFVGYYHKRQLLKAIQQATAQLESLNADYDALLQQLEKDPNLIKRIAPAVLGTQPPDANAVYPKVRVEQLAAARRALMEDLDRQTVDSAVPAWLIRCNSPRSRIVLFLAGACLVLISLVCFGPEKSSSRKG